MTVFEGKRISELPAAAAALGTMELPVNAAGAPKKLTVAQIQTLILAGATAATSGSTLPTQPAYGNNKPFFYTATGWNEYVSYDGAHWLTSAEHDVALGAGYIDAASSTTAVGVAQTHCGEMTALPIVGVVAVQAQALCRPDTANPGNYVRAYDYGGTADVATAYGGAAGYWSGNTGWLQTGGSNHRQIDILVGRAAGTVSYTLRVTTYRAHVIAT